MNIVLIGYRASGKTTVGKLLAEKMGIPFRDTDVLVEKNVGMPVKEILALLGWSFFRCREKEVVENIDLRENCVLATGGGVVLDPENVEVLKKSGIVIWLDAPLHDIIERLKDDARSGNTRPQFTCGDIEAETAEVLQRRLPLYRETADFTIDTAGKSALQIVEEITGYLEKREKYH